MSRPGAPPSPQTRGLRSALLVAFLVPTAIVLAVGGFLLFRISRNVLEEELGRSLSDIAATVASQVRGERVLAIEAGDDEGEGSRTFRSLSSQLHETRAKAQVRRILVVDAARRARLDVREAGATALAPMTEATELLRDSLEFNRVLAGERASSQVLFEGTDGQLYKTGYAPLLADGAVVGVVAVEGTAAFFGPLTGLRNWFLALAVLTLGLLAVTAVVVARGLAVPLERLVAAALRIGKGDLATPVAMERGSEIGILAGELEAMRSALDGRDRQLKLMLGGVAHEVKNPLGGIELFAGLLDEELKSTAPNIEDAVGHLARIRTELSYLKRIVEDFLAFAKERRLQREPFAAEGWLSEAVRHVSGEAQGQGVALALQAESATLQGDVGLLTSAVVNLVKNAVQVSKDGQRVLVTGHLVSEGYVCEVTDQGPGIAAQVQAHIFEPFFTTREKGTGLGLPLAKKLAEAHGGTLSVASQPGHTVFRLTLPTG
jgi:signal transduction histidine kinase